MSTPDDRTDPRLTDSTPTEPNPQAESGSVEEPTDSPESLTPANETNDAQAPEEEQTLAQPETEYGRIGYGRIARFTPMALAVVLMVVLVAAALWSQEDEPDDQSSSNTTSEVIQTGRMGQPAPDVSLTLFDGSTLRLADLQGSVVVVNFWASWCDPCRDEMPALQTISTSPPEVGVPVEIVGIAVQSDTEDDARAFVEEMGVSYSTGRDAGPSNTPTGPIQQSFAVGDFVPTTVFIAPDGTISMVHLGPLDEDQLQFYIERAVATPPGDAAA